LSASYSKVEFFNECPLATNKSNAYIWGVESELREKNIEVFSKLLRYTLKALLVSESSSMLIVMVTSKELQKVLFL